MEFWPQNGHFGSFSSFLNVAWVLFTQTTIGVVLKGKGKERKKIAKSVSWLGFESWSQLFTAKKHLTVGLHSNYGGQSPRPSGR
jgi:hypothetical protein